MIKEFEIELSDGKRVTVEVDMVCREHKGDVDILNIEVLEWVNAPEASRAMLGHGQWREIDFDSLPAVDRDRIDKEANDLADESMVEAYQEYIESAGDGYYDQLGDR